MEDTLLHRELTDRIINAFYHVYNKLGSGFAEKVYENALLLELRQRGFNVKQQAPIKVFYEGQVVGEFYADLVVEDLVILELKADEAIHSKHINQLKNYLRATKIEVGLLLNFGPKPEFQRKVFTNAKKKSATADPS